MEPLVILSVFVGASFIIIGSISLAVKGHPIFTGIFFTVGVLLVVGGVVFYPTDPTDPTDTDMPECPEGFDCIPNETMEPICEPGYKFNGTTCIKT